MSECCGSGVLVKLTPEDVDIEIYQGDTLDVGFLVRNQPVPPAVIGSVVDVTGSVFDAAMRNLQTNVVTSLPVTMLDTTAVSSKHGRAVGIVGTPGTFALDIHGRDLAGVERTVVTARVRVLRRRS